MRLLIISVFAAGLIVPTLALGSGVANPASAVGKENFGFTFEYEMQKKNVDDDRATSQRGLGKFIWGVTDRVEVYAKLGASNLKVVVADAQDYEGKRAMTWGGGLRAGLMSVERPKIRTYVDVQMLSFFTKGAVWRDSEGDTYKYSDRYKWNEVQISIVGVWERAIFMPYMGLGISNIFGNVSKDVYRVTGSFEKLIKHDAHDFREDAIPELMLGMDVGLGGTGRLNCEMRYSVDEDVSFSIGVSELWRVK